MTAKGYDYSINGMDLLNVGCCVLIVICIKYIHKTVKWICETIQNCIIKWAFCYCRDFTTNYILTDVHTCDIIWMFTYSDIMNKIPSKENKQASEIKNKCLKKYKNSKK